MVHGCMVYTERAQTAAVSCGSSHANAVSTPLRWVFKIALWRAIHSCRIICERSESARERRIARYKSNLHHHHHHISGTFGPQSPLWFPIPPVLPTAYRASCCWLFLYRAILHSRAESLRSHVIPHEWLAFYSAFLFSFLKIISTGMAGATWNCFRLGGFCAHQTAM